ncbi:dihydroneopterin triphosphate 2'-epimerase [Pleionea litopenaei]|uniref:Dihydroneopterin triphosphate 2'-epimerase n=1 Tax=Pleionea litopenaei TaxID=3070815 RepID=A0AA51RT20_9GAMM|nr:dihydroneopterin triphosphate 2'-epimerase [Pleionea sp. HL-JVS1]WMS87156.1 dihydroneopterin triphosphate 2'-epimerase [Pleionea sp. HL-JVS1]
MSSVKPLSNATHDYCLNNAVIHIKDLRLRTFIGFNPEELEKQQDIIINAEIEFDASKPCISDNEQETLDYKVITKAMIAHVEQGRFRLIEKLAADLLDIIMEQSQVLRATVCVDKPHALRFSDSVAITLTAVR